MSASNLERKIFTKIKPEVLLDFFRRYLALNGGRMNILKMMTGLNLWFGDTLRAARFMLDEGTVYADGSDLVLRDFEETGDESVLREYQWLVKRDLTCRLQDPLTDQERNLLKQFENLAQGRPDNDPRLEQYYVTAQTNLRRMKLLAREPFAGEKRICFLGDTDLTSLLAVLGGGFGEIAVYDIDTRIVNFINGRVRSLGIKNFQTTLHDYRRPLPDDKTFDIFHSDPPVTIDAVDLVLKRARECARGHASFYLSWPEHIFCPDYLLELQKTYARNGWLVTAKLPEFNEYANKCLLNYMSEKDRETLRRFKLQDGDVISAPPIYHCCLTRLLLSGGAGGEKAPTWEREITRHDVPPEN